jgi:type II secretion system protein G
MYKKSNTAAFTLLELLVAMAIMAILTVIGLRSFGSVQQKARDSRRKQDLQSISKALEIYYNDFKHYPDSTEGQISACGVDATQACSWGETWQNSSNQTLYMTKLPADPGGSQYFYLAGEDGKSYSLFAYLENGEDEAVAKDVDGNAAFYSGTSCRLNNGALLSDSCNYVTMSLNLNTTPEIVTGD